LEDFIDQEVTSLFIIELEDIGNFSKELKITDFLLGHGKKSINVGRREISLSCRRNRSIRIEQS
jgi:hypothetical protein